MAAPELQYHSDEHGHLTGVLVPIAIWREISAELETRYLLKSEPMRQRLLEARAQGGGLALGNVLDQLAIDEADIVKRP